MGLRTVISSFSVVAFLACGGGSKEAAEPAPDTTDEPSVCKVDDAMKATAKPKPKHEGCIDKAAWQKNAEACQNKDPVACYQIGVCVKLQSLGNTKLSAEERAKHFTAVLASMRVSCDAGMSDACIFRSGVINEALKENPNHAEKTSLKKEACADIIRACKLGNDQGCYGCSVSECK